MYSRHTRSSLHSSAHLTDEQPPLTMRAHKLCEYGSADDLAAATDAAVAAAIADTAREPGIAGTKRTASAGSDITRKRWATPMDTRARCTSQSGQRHSVYYEANPGFRRYITHSACDVHVAGICGRCSSRALPSACWRGAVRPPANLPSTSRSTSRLRPRTDS